MVAKKHKSKRQTCREKYKIIKRAAETRRSNRKNPVKKQSKKKEIPIPNNYPFKQQLLQKQAEIIQQKLDKKQAEKAVLQNEPENLKQPVEKKFIKKYTDIKTCLEADFILQVVDARDPLGSLIKLDRKSILVLTKIDLVPLEALNEWIKVFPNAVLFCRQDPVKFCELISKIIGSGPNKITVSCLGFPQVGKSSVVAALNLSNAKILFPTVCFSGSSDIKLSPHIILRNHTKSTAVDPMLCFEAVVSRFTQKQIQQLYSLPFYSGSSDLLIQYARLRGFVRRVI
jgi:nuclear GTP-binding protein